jgi:F420-non-reducing hydrogenase iron-sulfur subunit
VQLSNPKLNETFEPQILCCKYCAYAAGDLAGSMRLNYPPNVKVVQVPCTGRVDILHLLRAIEEGADASTWPADWRANVISWKEISKPVAKSSMSRER